ncbi:MULTISPECIES: hypothetical protein [unclassified Microcoleus]
MNSHFFVLDWMLSEEAIAGSMGDRAVQIQKGDMEQNAVRKQWFT